MQRRIFRPLFTILMVFFLTSEAEIYGKDTLLYMGLVGLIGGSTVTFIHNTVAPPSKGWIEVGGLLGFANLPVGITLILAGRAFESNGAMAAGSVNLAIGAMNIFASSEARSKLNEQRKPEEFRNLSFNVKLKPTRPSIQVDLRW